MVYKNNNKAGEKVRDDLDNIDESVIHILYKIEKEAKGQVIDELATDIELEVLLDVRQKLFVCSKKSYEELLSELNILEDGESTEMTLMQRRGKKDDGAIIAKDIVEMFEYVLGYSDNFPKSVLSRNSKFLEVTRVNPESGGTKTEPVITQEEIIINNILKDQQKDIKKLKDEWEKDRVRIVNLESELNELKCVVAQLKSTIELSTKPAAKQENTSPDKAKIPVRISPRGAYTHVESEDGYTTVLYKKNAKAAKYLNQSLDGNKLYSETLKEPERSGSKRKEDVETAGQVNAGSAPQKPDRHQVHVHHHNPSTQGPLQGRHTESATIRQESRGRTKEDQERGPGFNLQGIKQERGKRMYLTNIYMDEKSEESIIREIKTYTKTKGMRVMACRIIYNRYCQDVVGCQITIPESQVRIAVDPATWPNEITCREWEPRRRTNKQWHREEEQKPESLYNGHHDDIYAEYNNRNY